MQRLRIFFAIVLAISLTQLTVGNQLALADELDVSVDASVAA
ncbi:MAG: hypothetical protein QOF73_5079, partial [Thermomicrobiales bacterium]|nr:hypothetical protein [Thermomicrobiales bacterium]